MSRLPNLMKRTFSPGVMNWQGGFAGLFQLNSDGKKYEDPVLVSGSDGVGTKLKVAQMMGQHSSVGIDLVAMCANDVICCGAEPLFFLDYVAMSHDDPERLEQVVKGISDGCVDAGCSLLGGETAIMPGMYQQDDYDLAGFCMGVAEKDQLIQGQSIQVGDICLGIESSGFHSNGYSLVRKVVFEHSNLKTEDSVDFCDKTVGECLLEPTRIYAKVVKSVLDEFGQSGQVSGLAHISGGGLPENLDRILPEGTAAKVDSKSWEIPALFNWLQGLGKVDQQEMYRVFNMGIGFVLVVRPEIADSVLGTVEKAGHSVWKIGTICEGKQNVLID